MLLTDCQEVSVLYQETVTPLWVTRQEDIGADAVQQGDDPLLT